jgi:hypothetical protein
MCMPLLPPSPQECCPYKEYLHALAQTTIILNFFK